MQTPIGQELTFALPKAEYDSIPEAVIRKTRESLLRHIYGDTQVCLVTSANRSGKTRFADDLISACNDDIRIIRLNTQDFYSRPDSSFDDQPLDARQSDITLSLIKHCIVDSAALDEKLIIIIDDADYLSADVFEQLLNETLQDSNIALKTCFVFMGHPNLTGLLENISQTKDASFALLSLDNLSPANLHEYIDYCQSPTSEDQHIEFEDEAIRIILAQSGGSLFKATVILEWSLYYARERGLSSLDSEALEAVVTIISERSKSDQQNYFLSYPTGTNVFTVEKPEDEPSADGVQTEILRADLIDIDMEETIVLPNPRPPLLEKVVALRENDLLEPDKETLTPPSNTSDNARQSSDNNPVIAEPAKSRSVFKFILLGVLIGAALLYFSRVDTPNLKETKPGSPQDAEATSPGLPSDKIANRTAPGETAAEIIAEEVKAPEPIEKSLTPTDTESQRTKGASTSESEKTATSENSVGATEMDMNRQHNSEDASIAIYVPNTESGGFSFTDPSGNSFVSTDAVNRLLATAQHQFTQRKLTTPENDSAYNTYQVILQIDPGNRKALEGIRQITERYKLWADNSLKRNDIPAAKRYYARALRVSPDDYEIMALLKSLER